MSLRAAEIRVFSEFSRLTESGEVLDADRGGPDTKPREILSPAIARNALASFHILVDAKPEQKWSLYVGENPEKALAVTIYREVYANGIPVGLEKIDPPFRGAGKAIVWLDLWAARNAKVERVKIEPELQIEGVSDWVNYPMEVRIMSTVVPDVPRTPVAASVGASDAPGLANLAAWLCKTPATSGRDAAQRGPTVANFLMRNATQDKAMLQASAEVDWLWLATKASDRRAWCRAPARPAEASAEWYLKVRDRLIAR